ncbi:hypothetical protein JCM6882_007409 [Rhodosporidiobolus microsporus]
MTGVNKHPIPAQAPSLSYDQAFNLAGRVQWPARAIQFHGGQGTIHDPEQVTCPAYAVELHRYNLGGMVDWALPAPHAARLHPVATAIVPGPNCFNLVNSAGGFYPTSSKHCPPVHDLRAVLPAVDPRKPVPTMLSMKLLGEHTDNPADHSVSWMIRYQELGGRDIFVQVRFSLAERAKHLQARFPIPGAPYGHGGGHPAHALRALGKYTPAARGMGNMVVVVKNGRGRTSRSF